jgi:hypothetical protein
VDTRTATQSVVIYGLTPDRARRGGGQGDTELLNAIVEALNGLLVTSLELCGGVVLSLYEALETLLLARGSSRGTSTPRRELTIQVGAEEGSCTEVVGRRHWGV